MSNLDTKAVAQPPTQRKRKREELLALIEGEPTFGDLEEKTHQHTQQYRNLQDAIAHENADIPDHVKSLLVYMRQHPEERGELGFDVSKLTKHGISSDSIQWAQGQGFIYSTVDEEHFCLTLIDGSDFVEPNQAITALMSIWKEEAKDTNSSLFRMADLILLCLNGDERSSEIADAARSMTNRALELCLPVLELLVSETTRVLLSSVVSHRSYCRAPTTTAQWLGVKYTQRVTNVLITDLRNWYMRAVFEGCTDGIVDRLLFG